jgi:hypothetical protein
MSKNVLHVFAYMGAMHLVNVKNIISQNQAMSNHNNTHPIRGNEWNDVGIRS